MATLTIESNGEVIHSMVMIAILVEQYGHTHSRGSVQQKAPQLKKAKAKNVYSCVRIVKILQPMFLH